MYRKAWADRHQRKNWKVRMKAIWFRIEIEQKSENGGKSEKERGGMEDEQEEEKTGERGHPIAVLNVPCTPMGKLAKLIQKAENRFAEMHKVAWIKIVESGGKKLKDMLIDSNPWKETDCERERCITCMTAGVQSEDVPGDMKAKAGTCKTRNITYEIFCVTCMRNGELTKYVGETARSAYERGKEHLDGLRRAAREGTLPTEPEERGNPLYKHQLGLHREQQPEYWMSSAQTQNPNGETSA